MDREALGSPSPRGCGGTAGSRTAAIAKASGTVVAWPGSGSPSVLIRSCRARATEAVCCSSTGTVAPVRRPNSSGASAWLTRSVTAGPSLAYALVTPRPIPQTWASTAPAASVRARGRGSRPRPRSPRSGPGRS
ncbi:hypothetical protein ACFQ0T_27330 [Kitasatospora gansuensis]